MSKCWWQTFGITLSDVQKESHCFGWTRNIRTTWVAEGGATESEHVDEEQFAYIYNYYRQLHMNISWNAPWTLATNSDTSGLRYGPKCIDILWLEMNQHESAKINLLWNKDMGSHFVASSKSNSKMLIRLEKPFHLALLAVWCLIRPRGDSMT